MSQPRRGSNQAWVFTAVASADYDENIYNIGFAKYNNVEIKLSTGRWYRKDKYQEQQYSVGERVDKWVKGNTDKMTDFHIRHPEAKPDDITLPD